MVTNECIDAVASICAILSTGDLAKDAALDGPLTRFVDLVLPACVETVEKPASLPRARLDAGRALASCCRASVASCLKTLKGALGPLLARHAAAAAADDDDDGAAAPVNTTMRRADVVLASALVDAASQCVASAATAPAMHPLRPYRDALLVFVVRLVLRRSRPLP